MTITEPRPVTVDADVEGSESGTEPDGEAVEAVVDRLFAAVLGAQQVQAAYIGHHLGWYAALAERGPLTAPELAAATDSDARYAREWLEHQTVTQYLEVDDPAQAPDDRTYRLPAAAVPVFADPDSLAHVLPFARFVAGLGIHIEKTTEAFRTGAGVSWAEFGADARESQAAANRPMFLHELGPDHVASIPDVDAALRAGGRVADVGCGAGWSSIGIAATYPQAAVDGYDIDEPSIDLARANAEEHGVAGQARFHAVDAATIAGDEPYDLVLALECIHDLADPVAFLATMRDLAGEDGAVIVMDERVGEQFTGEPDDVEAVFYGFSITCCLPDGRSHDHSRATGTVMRPDTLAGYAREAGFSGADVLPIENDFFRFYRLQ